MADFFLSFVFSVYGFNNKVKLFNNVNPLSENFLTAYGLKIAVKTLSNFLFSLYSPFYQLPLKITLFPTFTFVDDITNDQINETNQSLSKPKNKRVVRIFTFL